MFRLLGRIFNVIMEFFGDQVRDLEWKKPEAVLEDALRKKRANLERFYNAVAELETLKNNQAANLKNKQIQIERLEAQIMGAARNGDSEKGVILLMKKKQLEKNIGNDVESLKKRVTDIDSAKKKLAAAQQELAVFEVRKIETIAEIKMLQAQKNIGRINDRFFGAEDMKALDDLTRRIEMERNKDKIFKEITGEFYEEDVDYLDAKEEFKKISYGITDHNSASLQIIDADIDLEPVKSRRK
ncbi:MAG TPA: hypothetical protein PKM18_11290 [bacterium]|nr:hypothetical protein [bacterium]